MVAIVFRSRFRSSSFADSFLLRRVLLHKASTIKFFHFALSKKIKSIRSQVEREHWLKTDSFPDLLKFE